MKLTFQENKKQQERINNDLYLEENILTLAIYPLTIYFLLFLPTLTTSTKTLKLFIYFH